MSPALFFVKANVYGLNIIHEKYERLRWLRITRSTHLPPMGCSDQMTDAIANSQRRVRNKSLYPSLPDGSQGIGWPFFPARTEWHVRAGVTFFSSPYRMARSGGAIKKSDEGKNAVIGKFRFTEKVISYTSPHATKAKTVMASKLPTSPLRETRRGTLM